MEKELDLMQEKIETDRLLMIPLSDIYAEEIFEYFTKEVTVYTFPKSPDHISETLEWISGSIPKIIEGVEFPVVITNKQTGEFLGCGGLHQVDSKSPEIGIWIKIPAHGNGYGIEAVKGVMKWALDNIDFDYLLYPVDERNTASRKIPEKFGGVTDGTIITRITPDKRELRILEYKIYKNRLINMD